MAKSSTINLEPLDRADRLFLENGLARGMSVAEIAGFLNRSEDEIEGYLTRSSSSLASRARDNQPRST
jgi:IS30 family transposase